MLKKLYKHSSLLFVRRYSKVFILGTIVVVAVMSLQIFVFNNLLNNASSQKSALEKQLSKTKTELSALKNQDQYKINQKLKEDIAKTEKVYSSSVSTYEKLVDLKVVLKDTSELDKIFARSLKYLSELNYSSAEADLKLLSDKIDSEKQKLTVTLFATASFDNATVSNVPPGSGYSRQKVNALDSSYFVDIVAADLGSTRVIVDTASDGDCRDNCPVMSLGDYVSRSGAFAGVNGSYFCPAAYPTCAGKSNTYDTLLMNKNKVYFNSDNNVYSTVPAVIFGGGWVRFVGQSLEWGRDTGVDGVLANQPLLVSGGNVVFGGDGDPKKGGKGSRSFVANKGNTIYIGVTHSVTVAEMAHVLKALGMENALNLDSGGSTALWSGGYKVGPGRNIPNAILFVGK